MTNSEEQPPAASASTAEVAIKAVRKTFLLLMFAVACFGLLVALYLDLVTLPWRDLAIALMTFCIAGPFVAAYSTLVTWYYTRRSMIPTVLVDRDQQELHLKYFSPDKWSELEVEGSLGDRRTNAGKAYIAEEYRVEQRERVNPDTGEVEQVPQPVLRASWEGFIDPYEFLETVAAFRKAKEELVPLVQEAIEAKVGQDIAP